MCVSLGVFVCTRCSGIMRDFNFRIKSISASTFSGDEVEALRRGGNDEARRVYLARWPRDRTLPQCGDTVNGKAWIKEVLVEKRWYDATASAQATPTQVSATPAKPAPATTHVPDLFGGLFDSPTPAPAPQQQQHQQQQNSAGWMSFDSVAVTEPQRAPVQATVSTFAPPPTAPQPSYGNFAPPPQAAAPEPQQQAGKTQQLDLFGGLTVETPARAATAPAPAPTHAPTPRAPLEEDFWTLTPPAPSQPQPTAAGMGFPSQVPGMQMPGMPQASVPAMPMPAMPMPGMPAMPMPGLPGLPAMPMPGMPGMPAMPMPGMTAMPMPGMTAMPMPGMPMPGQPAMPMPGQPAMPMPGQQAMPMPGTPAMPMPGLTMSGMQMPGPPPQAAQAPPQAVAQQTQALERAQAEPEKPDPFASFGALTGIAPTAHHQSAHSAPTPARAIDENLFAQQTDPAPAKVAPVMPHAEPVRIDTMKVGSMGFPVPASQPPTTANDAHQAMMFEDMKTHAAGDSFSFAPVDTPQPSVALPKPQTQQQKAPAVTAQPTAAASQYSADNPFAFI